MTKKPPGKKPSVKRTDPDHLKNLPQNVQGEIKKAQIKEKNPDKADRIVAYLKTFYPDLLVAMCRAMDSKGMCFRLAWYETDPDAKPDKLGNVRDIQHHRIIKGMPNNDVLGIMQHEKRWFMQDRMPNIEQIPFICENCRNPLSCKNCGNPAADKGSMFT